MPPVLTDPIYQCARAYQDMIDAEIAFDVEVVSGNVIHKIEIKPNEFEFKHLTGVQHLTDLIYLQNSNSEDLLSDFLTGKLQIGNLSSSTHFHDISPSGYEIMDRINVLTNYQQIMESIGSASKSGTLKTFKWERNAQQIDRPYKSKVNADYLFQFQVKGYPYPYMNFFFKNEGNGHLAGISCFPSTQDYSHEIRTLKNGEIQHYKLSEAKVLTITETSRDNPDIPLKTITAADRQALQDKLNAELYADFAKKVTLEIVKDLRKDKNISERINKYTENKNDKYPDVVLEMVKNRLQTFTGSEKPEVSAKIEECILKIDDILKFRQHFEKLNFARKQAFHNTDEYIELAAVLPSIVNNIYKCEYALKELDEQSAEIAESNQPEKEDLQALLQDEKKSVQDRWQQYNQELIKMQSANFSFTVTSPQIQTGNALAIAEQKTVTLQIPLPPKKPFRALWQKIQQFGSQLQEKVSEILNFFKKPTDDSDADSDSMNTHTPPKFISSALPEKEEKTNQDFIHQEQTYSLAQKSKSYRVIFQENAGMSIENCADYDMIIKDKDITGSIISDNIGRQAELEIPMEKEVKQMEENIYQKQYQEQDFSEPERKRDYEYDR